MLARARQRGWGVQLTWIDVPARLWVVAPGGGDVDALEELRELEEVVPGRHELRGEAAAEAGWMIRAEEGRVIVPAA